MRPRTAFQTFALLLALCAGGCGEPARFERLPAHAVVLAFGDSLTHGTGAREEESYPARLGKAQAERNVREMVKLARGRGVDVLLIGTPEPGFTVTPPDFYEDIAEEFRLPYEGKVVGEVLRDVSLKADPIHPNARGYELIAARIAGALRKSGAL